MKDIMEQLGQRYPFMKKKGEIHYGFNKRKVLKRYRKEKLLILLVGVQGSGKTTYSEKNFAEYCPVNIDNVLLMTRLKYWGEMSPRVDRDAEKVFFDTIEKQLETNQISVVDSGALKITFRVYLLNKLKDKYTKVIMLVLNPDKKVIKKHIERQMWLRDRPGLWEDVNEECFLMEEQIKEDIFPLGVDDVYFI